MQRRIIASTGTVLGVPIRSALSRLCGGTGKRSIVTLPRRRIFPFVCLHQKSCSSLFSTQAKVQKIQTKSVGKEGMSMDNSSETMRMSQQSAILRYQKGQEKFQLKLIHNNKVFNFERSMSETLQVFKDRMITNITKKLKDKWDGKVVIYAVQGDNGRAMNVIGEEDHALSIATFLDKIISEGKDLAIQVSEQLYDVTINPPEIHSLKFLKQVTAGFPIFPYKIETSSNFSRDLSIYKWEYTKEEVSKGGDKNWNKKKSRSPSSENNAGSSSSSTCENGGWIDTGSSSYIFTPNDDLLGARIRFTCTPSSDGKYFGLPVTEELPAKLQSLQVKEPLYFERCKRLQESSTGEQKKDPNFLRVVSYNCLAECYATEEWFIASPKEALPVDFRLPFLCREFSSYMGDLYCLQEIEDKYFERIFLPFFECSMGFKGFMSSKTGSVKEGVAMFYNPLKLTPIKNETIEVGKHLQTMGIWSQIPNSVIQRFEDRNTVLQLSAFRPTSQQDMIMIVANTHLYFHPDADHIRLLQTIGCVDYIQIVCSELRKNFPDLRVSVLFCGDFNCTPPYSSFRYLTTGKIESDDFDWTSHPTEKLESGIAVQHNLQLTNSHPNHELTNITSSFEGCLDYILYQPEQFDLLSVHSPPDKETLAKLCGVSETRLVSFPNYYTPSDHLPLISDFRIK